VIYSASCIASHCEAQKSCKIATKPPRIYGGFKQQTLVQQVISEFGAGNYPIFSIRFALFASIAALVSGGMAIASMERNVSAMNIRPS
jgi:hypothetical protein